MKFKAVFSLASALVIGNICVAWADDSLAQADDDFMHHSAAQAALAVLAQQCDLRSSAWRDKLIVTITARLAKHFKKVRPTWSGPEDDAIAGQIVYGAVYGAKGETGAPAADPSDMMKLGEQEMAKSMACQVAEYRKTELLFLDRIIEEGGS
jgi:hypothetical protein